MGREYEPTVGQWYEDLENEETFQVLKVDEDREIVEIQHLDGDVEEPEGWSGSKAEKDAEEDEEDEDDWDDDDEDDDDDLDDDDDEEHDEY